MDRIRCIPFRLWNPVGKWKSRSFFIKIGVTQAGVLREHRRMQLLVLRDLSASPDAHFTERILDRWASDEDRAILEAWSPTLCVRVRVG